MATALQLIQAAQAPPLDRPIRTLPVPWRDPHSVSPGELKEYIGFLERACEEHPRSADLRTCLGMAYAMDYEVYKSMDALETATALDEAHFFAQMKYAELFFRLRALERAEEETAKALNLAGNGWELSMARQQLQEIRLRRREGTRKPTWNKPLRTPALAFLALVVFLFTLMAVFK
jgi:hypothetical protein